VVRYNCDFLTWFTGKPYRQKYAVGSLAYFFPAIVLLLGFSLSLQAGEADIRQNLPTLLPDLPEIDEVIATPVPGLWEVRMGSQILYSDDSGAFVVKGELYNLRQRVNLTQQRVDELTAFKFDTLPLEDAVVWKQGKGERKLVIFADPNCGYCKRFEKELNDVLNITVYTFLIPILGGDSPDKSRSIWCAKDPATTWRRWMVNGEAPPTEVPADCDVSALQRNVVLGDAHAVSGTPTLVFENSVRIPGILSMDELEQQFAQIDK